MRFQRQSKKDQDINLTPLIDVVFLLLIFFMVSTTFTKETHLQVELPHAEGESSNDKPDKLEVLVTKGGSYSVNGRPLVNRKIATLVAALKGASNGNAELPVTITADANSSHQAVVTAMDAAGKAGFVHLSITTQRSEDSP